MSKTKVSQRQRGKTTQAASRSTSTRTLANAFKAFLEDRDLSDNTRRNYATLKRILVDACGPRAPVTTLTTPRLRRILTATWGDAAPGTWNARLAALQSFCSYCRRQKWMGRDPTAGLERRRVLRDETRAIPYDDIAALWLRADIHLREKLLWRCLYATAARTRELLSLDIEDIDLPRKRAVVVGKGGHRETIIWDAATARLMRRYIGERRRGPLFVTYGQPNDIPAEADRAPDGRARLSYQRAWELFRAASRGKWTLHQLRHSALTHLGEKGVSAPLLMAKSRHRDPRTLSRYVQPGVEAVAELTARYDPERRFPAGNRRGDVTESP